MNEMVFLPLLFQAALPESAFQDPLVRGTCDIWMQRCLTASPLSTSTVDGQVLIKHRRCFCTRGGGRCRDSPCYLLRRGRARAERNTDTPELVSQGGL